MVSLSEFAAVVSIQVPKCKDIHRKQIGLLGSLECGTRAFKVSKLSHKQRNNSKLLSLRYCRAEPVLHLPAFGFNSFQKIRVTDIQPCTDTQTHKPTISSPGQYYIITIISYCTQECFEHVLNQSRSVHVSIRPHMYTVSVHTCTSLVSIHFYPGRRCLYMINWSDHPLAATCKGSTHNVSTCTRFVWNIPRN